MKITILLGTTLGILLTGMTAVAADEPTTTLQPWSPQTFCTDHGGVVTQTGDPQVHVCCYAQTRRCISVDERSRSTELLSGIKGSEYLKKERRPQRRSTSLTASPPISN